MNDSGNNMQQGVRKAKGEWQQHSHNYQTVGRAVEPLLMVDLTVRPCIVYTIVFMLSLQIFAVKQESIYFHIAVKQESIYIATTPLTWVSRTVQSFIGMFHLLHYGILPVIFLPCCCVLIVVVAGLASSYYLLFLSLLFLTELYAHY